MRPRPDMVDVLVVGFGPVGAALAGLLGKRGIDVLVLERDYEVFPLPRAAHVDHTGLRTWQELDLLDRLLPAMQTNPGLDFLTAHGGLLAVERDDHGGVCRSRGHAGLLEVGGLRNRGRCVRPRGSRPRPGRDPRRW